MNFFDSGRRAVGRNADLLRLRNAAIERLARKNTMMLVGTAQRAQKATLQSPRAKGRNQEMANAYDHNAMMRIVLYLMTKYN